MAEDDLVQELREVDFPHHRDLVERAADEIDFLRLKVDGLQAQVATYKETFNAPAGEKTILGLTDKCTITFEKVAFGKLRLASNSFRDGVAVVLANQVFQASYNGATIELAQKPRGNNGG